MIAYFSIFQETKTIETKLVPETYKFLIKIYLESFVFTFLIIFAFVFNIELIVHQKNNQYRAVLSENAPWVPGMFSDSLTYCFSFFSITAAFEVNSCIFVLKCLSRYLRYTIFL